MKGWRGLKGGAEALWQGGRTKGNCLLGALSWRSNTQASRLRSGGEKLPRNAKGGLRIVRHV